VELFSVLNRLLPKMSKPKIVNSIVRAALILKTLSNGNSRIGKISESVKLSKGTTHRLLLTLAKVGFVVQDPLTQRYHLGPGLLQLFSDPILSHNSLISCAFEEMTCLNNLTRDLSISNPVSLKTFTVFSAKVGTIAAVRSGLFIVLIMPFFNVG